MPPNVDQTLSYAGVDIDECPVAGPEIVQHGLFYGRRSGQGPRREQPGIAGRGPGQLACDV